MMNLNRMKPKSILVLIIVALLSFSMLFVIGLSNTKLVSASAYLTDNVVMDDGAYVYVDSENPTHSGIKFKARVTSVNSENTYGMMIVPYDYFAKCGVSTDGSKDYIKEFNDAKTAGTIVHEPIIKELVPNEQGEMEISFSQILPNNYDRQFVGLAFEKTGETYKYSEITEGNIRDVVYMASVHLDKVESGAIQEKADVVEALKGFITTGKTNVGEAFKYEISGDTTKEIGEKVNLALTVSGLKLNNATWSVNDENLATLKPSEDGLTCEVELKEVGEVIVTAKTAGGFISDEFTISATASFDDEELLFIDNESVKDLFSTNAGNTSKSYIENSAFSQEGLSGDYTGNAVKLAFQGQTIITSFVNNLPQGKLTYYKNQGYTKIYIWVAIKFSNDSAEGNLTFSTKYEDCLFIGNAPSERATWERKELTITDIESKLYEGSAVELFSVYRTGVTSVDINVYIGDMGFVTPETLSEGELFYIKDASVANDILVDNGTNFTATFLNATDWATEGIVANGYTGNAIKLVASVAGSRTWSFYHSLTENQYNDYVTKGYKKLYIWFAAITTGNSVQMGTATNSTQLIKTSFTTGSWIKYEITLDDAKTKLLSNPAVLFKPVADPMAGSITTVYLGNIGFEK